MNDAEMVKEILTYTSRGDVESNFERIELGTFAISVQGGSENYSAPKESLSAMNDYTQYEVAIFEKDAAWIKPAKDARFKGFFWAKLFERGIKNPVARYVNRDIVEQIMVDLLVVTMRSLN